MGHFARLFLFTTISSLLLISGCLGQVQLRVIRQWKFLNYTWASPESLQASMDNGLYVPENIVASGIVYYNDFYYLTMPRMKTGVPATLGRITAIPGGSTAPLIAPYPSWEFNKEGDCDALQNVQNIEIDTTGTMWIIDGGHTGSLTPSPVKNCSPKLIIYDTKTNQVKATYIFPDSVASKTDSFLYEIVIDDGDFAYITDNSARDPGIIVYSRLQNRSWKIRHSKTMRADSAAQGFRLNGVPVNAAINLAGIALGPKIKKTQQNETAEIVIDEDREVFYCPLSSTHLYSLSTSVLQDEMSSNNGRDYEGYVRDVGVKGSRTDGMIMTSRGVLYYGLLPDNAIAAWDSQKPLISGSKIISRDPTYIQWTNSFTIDDQGNLTILTDTLQKFIYDKLDVSKYNFWLISANISDKSYIYDDPTYVYTPVTETAVPGNNSKGDNKNHNQSSVPDSGSVRILEVTAILTAVIVYILS